MPIYKCSKCGCIDNTAMTNYWWDVQHDKKPALCSVCDPEIGEWHGEFERKTTEGFIEGDDGFLYHNEGEMSKYVKPVAATRTC